MLERVPSDAVRIKAHKVTDPETDKKHDFYNESVQDISILFTMNNEGKLENINIINKYEKTEDNELTIIADSID
ncbi:MAG: hypothetical protein HRT47_00895 [Candidatus Caenarcaniphilales bacterium]|nr:hypothetical protein [Candidatus Caenarcaniphilales bacterium]